MNRHTLYFYTPEAPSPEIHCHFVPNEQLRQQIAIARRMHRAEVDKFTQTNCLKTCTTDDHQHLNIDTLKHKPFITTCILNAAAQYFHLLKPMLPLGPPPSLRAKELPNWFDEIVITFRSNIRYREDYIHHCNLTEHVVGANKNIIAACDTLANKVISATPKERKRSDAKMKLMHLLIYLHTHRQENWCLKTPTQISNALGLSSASLSSMLKELVDIHEISLISVPMTSSKIIQFSTLPSNTDINIELSLMQHIATIKYLEKTYLQVIHHSKLPDIRQEAIRQLSLMKYG
ncbi:hypothetical protein ACNO5M_10270 [Vibrio owensii]|uniref:hypothetical protein n=1 Tax=Vibrio owensii TaxID=696485 RepID=UPI003AAC0148